MFCRNRGRKKYNATTRTEGANRGSFGKRGGGTSKSRGGQGGRGAMGGRNTYGASTSGSYQTMQSNRSLPPSNRPGFMPAPRVAMLQK